MTAAPEPTTHHSALRPGQPVLPRDNDTIQVGLRPPGAAHLPNHPDVVALLTDLQCGVDVRLHSPVAASAWRSLQAAGLLCEAGAATAQDRAQFGQDAGRRARQRSSHRVRVHAGTTFEQPVAELLTDAGLDRDDLAATVHLLVSVGPISRNRLDPLLRAGIPHLVVTAIGGGWRIGPLVEPGRTACLRCVDAHEASDDPRLPLLLEAAAAEPGDQPIDPVLERLALSWAVRDLTRWAEGDEPSTWSATVDVGATAAPEVTRWLRHPHCGCAWDAQFLDLP